MRNEFTAIVAGTQNLSRAFGATDRQVTLTDRPHQRACWAAERQSPCPIPSPAEGRWQGEG
jgi:hypothetical protein